MYIILIKMYDLSNYYDAEGLCHEMEETTRRIHNKASYRIMRVVSQAKLKDRRHPNGQEKFNTCCVEIPVLYCIYFEI